MAIENDTVLTLMKLATVSLGLVFLWVAYQAWHRSRSPRMLTLMAAVVLMTLAALAEGIAYRGLGLTLDQSHLIEAVVMLAAFAVLVGSLFVPQRHR